MISLVHKLRGRSATELRYRGRQAALSWLERFGLGDVAESPLRPESEAVATWLERFRARGGRGFFAGLDDIGATLSAARQIDQASLDRHIAVADAALRGRFDVLGYQGLDFGMPINWHRDPTVNVTAPVRHWSTIPYLDPAVVGDHKIVWELNRHQWMVSCALAHHITGRAIYGEFVDAQLVAWMDANSPKQGVNWASSLEIAFRAISWLWTFRLLAVSPSLRDDTIVRAIAHLQRSAQHLLTNLSTYFSPNTHLTGEALGLYYLGSELAGLQGASAWRATGRRILLEWLPRHIRPDGTYFEQATWYQRYTADFYTHFHLLAERSQDALPEHVSDAVRRSGVVLSSIMRPDGSMPLIGDDDGGRLLFLDHRTANDPRPAVRHAGLVSDDAALCARGDVTLETLLLFGASATRQTLPRATPPGSQCFADGGLVVLRGTDSVMTVDAGVHGAMNCGHAHADALSFDLSLSGQPVFVDPGTMAYTRDATLRDAFRSTRAHNAATVNGADSSQMRGPFAWNTRTDARIERWLHTEAGDLLLGAHDGFGIPYTREILRLPVDHADVWIVRDRCESSSSVTFDVHLQCAAGLTAIANDLGALIHDEGRPVAQVWTSAADLVVGAGAVSSVYGKADSAAHISLRTRGSGNLDIVTVIAPHLESVTPSLADADQILEVRTAQSMLSIPLSGTLDPARVRRSGIPSLRST